MDMGIRPAVHKELVMNAMKIVGIVLIIAGGLGLAYGGFSFTKETHKAEVGPLKFSVAEKEQVNVPQWLGIGAIVAGVVLLVLPSKKG
jgi:multidrug transporter EmrE-like cation transporter